MSAHTVLGAVSLIASITSDIAIAVVLYRMFRHRTEHLPTPLVATWVGGAALACTAYIAGHNWILTAVTAATVVGGLVTVAVWRQKLRVAAEARALREQAAQRDRFYAPGMWN